MTMEGALPNAAHGRKTKKTLCVALGLEVAGGVILHRVRSLFHREQWRGRKSSDSIHEQAHITRYRILRQGDRSAYIGELDFVNRRSLPVHSAQSAYQRDPGGQIVGARAKDRLDGHILGASGINGIDCQNVID